MFLWNWLKKRFGYHVCEEFTQWTKITVKFSRPCDVRDGNRYTAGVQTIQYSRTFQERQCTLCGKVQQQEMEFP